MKSIKCVTLAAIVAMTSCSNEVDEKSVSINNNTPVLNLVTFSGGADDVSVLVFKEKDEQFFYSETISGDWSEEGRLIAPLEIGDYKFMFSKFAKVNSSFFPNPLSVNNTKFEDVYIKAIDDEQREGYVLPIDEIFLPDISEANTAIKIQGSDTVRSELSRAVSQATLILKRGYKDSKGNYIEQPFENNESILDIIESIEFDIKGVGNELYLDGSKGQVNTFYSTSQIDYLMTGGYAHFTGPFVIPSDSEDDSQIDIKILTKADSGYPEMTSTVYGPFEKNKRLEITLWFAESYEIITIQIKLKDMTESMDGDIGIWE